VSARTLRDPLTLASGRVVLHLPLTNGAHEAVMQDGGDMSESEWDEYCQAMRVRNAPARHQADLRRRRALGAAMMRNKL